jgi:hypothetical protein
VDHDTTGDVTFTARCASCGKLLGHVDRDGWAWNGSPARLVNRRRFIMSAPADGSMYPELPSAPSDDFRMRAVQRSPGEPEYTLWEYPYVCDSDVCTEALGDDWKSTAKDPSPRFTRMPPGRTLS